MNWRNSVGCAAALLVLGCGASTSGEHGGAGSGGGGGPPIAGDCASAPEPTANVVYVCDCATAAGAESGCQPGSDANSGADKAHPLRTWPAVYGAWSALPAGGTVALCKGGGWTTAGGQYWHNTRCTASSPCTIREYQAPWGGSGKPRVLGTAANPVLTFGNGGAHDESGYRVWNVALVGSDLGGSAGITYWDVVTDSDLCNLDISHFAIGVYPAGGPGGGSGMGWIQQRITLRSSYLHDNGQWAGQRNGEAGDGWLGTCPHCVVDANLFENNGATPYMFNHQLYLSTTNGASITAIPGMRVTNNRFWTHGARCAGVRVVVHQPIDGALFENNLVQNDFDVTDTGGGCWSFSIGAGGYGCPIQYSSTVVRRNRLIGAGGNTVLSIEQSVGTVIESNVVEVIAGGTGLQIPGHLTSGCYPANSGTVIRNNSIRLLGEGATGINNQASEGTDHIIANNAIFSTSPTYTCISWRSPATYDGSNVCTTTSPFVDAAAGDYRPLAGGPLVGAGSSTYSSPSAIGTVTWSASDPGSERTGAIDIGAFQR